jgi:AbrB family looped-hinge helix DNA binding protein
MRTTIDAAGRIVIPKAIRERAGLYVGVSIDVRVDDDGVILTPAPAEHRLVRRGRLLVVARSEEAPLVTDEDVEAIRDEILSERAHDAWPPDLG